MSTKKFALTVSLVVMFVVIILFFLVQYNGGLGNENLVCDLVMKRGDC